MHKTISTFITLLGIGMALAPTAMADEATSDLFLTRSACSGASDVLKLQADLQAYTGNCGTIPQALGGSPDIYPGETLAPFSLDASRTIAVAIATTAQGGLGSIGDQTVEVTLEAKKATGNSIVVLGSGSHTRPAADMLRKGSTLDEFEFVVPASKAGPYKQFTLTLQVGGSELGGYVNHGGGSYVSLPIFDPIEEPEA